MEVGALPNTAVDAQDKQGRNRQVEEGWRNVLNEMRTINNAIVQSGTTANRPAAPASVMWVGRMYFDTDLGFPIWFVGPGWVDATGAPA